MRFVALLAVLLTASCGSGEGNNGYSGTQEGGPSAFGANQGAPSFGGTSGSAPSFGEQAGSATGFGDNASNGGGGGDPTAVCSSSTDCTGGAVCARGSSSTLGFCTKRCVLAGSGDVESGSCPGGLLCLRTDTGGSVGVCLRGCTTVNDCPVLAGLAASCVRLTTTQRGCIWNQLEAPTAGSDAGG